MGNANNHPKAGTKELRGRIQPGTTLGATGKREKSAMEELAKAREKEKKRKDLQQAKIEKRDADRDWQVASEAMNDGVIQHILKPFESWTGIECVANHAEPDEEEDVEDYEDEQPSARARSRSRDRGGGAGGRRRGGDGEDDRPRMNARQRVGMMMAKAQREELEGSESEEEAEC